MTCQTTDLLGIYFSCLSGFYEPNEQRTEPTCRPIGWSALTLPPEASTLLVWRVSWIMTHHSTSGRTSTGELLVRIILNTGHCRSIRLCFKFKLVCAQDRKDSQSGESRPGFYFPVRSAGETLLHTHCIHLDTVHQDKQHVESRLNIFLSYFTLRRRTLCRWWRTQEALGLRSRLSDRKTWRV